MIRHDAAVSEMATQDRLADAGQAQGPHAILGPGVHSRPRHLDHLDPWLRPTTTDGRHMTHANPPQPMPALRTARWVSKNKYTDPRACRGVVCLPRWRQPARNVATRAITTAHGRYTYTYSCVGAQEGDAGDAQAREQARTSTQARAVVSGHYTTAGGRGAGSGSGHGKGKGVLPMHRDLRVLSRAGVCCAALRGCNCNCNHRWNVRQDCARIRGRLPKTCISTCTLCPSKWLTWIPALHPRLVCCFFGREAAKRGRAPSVISSVIIHSLVCKLASKLPATPTSDLSPRPTLISPVLWSMEALGENLGRACNTS